MALKQGNLEGSKIWIDRNKARRFLNESCTFYSITHARYSLTSIHSMLMEARTSHPDKDEVKNMIFFHCWGQRYNFNFSPMETVPALGPGPVPVANKSFSEKSNVLSKLDQKHDKQKTKKGSVNHFNSLDGEHYLVCLFGFNLYQFILFL